MIVAVLAPVCLRDLGVVQPAIEHPDDRPALSDVAELVQRAQVAEEPLGLLERLEATDRLEQSLDVGSVFQSSAIVPWPLVHASLHRGSVVACYYGSMMT